MISPILIKETLRSPYFWCFYAALACAYALFAYINWHYSLPQSVWGFMSLIAVSTPELKMTLGKITSRLWGTVAGALYAYLVVQLFGSDLIILFIALLPCLFIASLCYQQKNDLSYFGLMMNVTMVIVLANSLNQHNIMDIVVDRTLQVGLSMCIFSAFLMIFCWKFLSPREFLKTFWWKFSHLFRQTHFRLNASMWFCSLRLSLAVLCTFGSWIYFDYPGGFWATVSCFFVIEENRRLVYEKVGLRLLGQTAAATCVIVSFFLLGEHLRYFIFPFLLGMFVCLAIIFFRQRYSSLGNTLGIAMAVMFFYNTDHSTAWLAIDRVANVMLGVTIALCIESLPFLRPRSETHTLQKNDP